MSIQAAMMLAFADNKYMAPPGEIIITTTGTTDFVVPDGVESISFVLISGNTTEIGGLMETSSVNTVFRVTGGSQLNYPNYAGVGGTAYINAGAVYGSAGIRNGGSAGNSARSGDVPGGGGGCAGYSGNGGTGGAGANPATTANTRYSGPGGGVGLYGEGPSGAGGTHSVEGVSITTIGGNGTGGGGGGGSGAVRGYATGAGPGEGGSGGTAGTITGSALAGYTASGGLYGGGRGRGASGDEHGGSGLLWVNEVPVTKGQVIPVVLAGVGAACRIIWNGNRSFPFNAGPM